MWTQLRRAAAVPLSLVLALSLAAAPAPAATGLAGPAAVADELRATVLQAQGERVQALLMLPNPSRFDSDPDRVVAGLREHARQTQEEVEIALEQQAETQGDVRVLNRFWITNMLLVEFGATEARLEALSQTPGVQRVLPNFTVTAPPAGSAASSDPGATIVDGRITWGVNKIGAERVWNELGINGSGVRVVTLDTGVAITHPDLAGKMVSDRPGDPNYPGGWMEFSSTGGLVASAPHDSAYHGTHVSGTIHGGNTSGVIIGVAPQAEMAHGLVIPGGSGSFTQVAAGMQWAIAPTDATGAPAGRPADVVNMSLGANSYVAEMIAPTRAIAAAGAFPAFAIGNANPTCGVGSGSPGNVYEAVGVGATDATDNVASFSCGNVVQKSSWANPPADWPDSYVTPDLSAPGVQVWSADPNGTYRYLSGTSMAAPHTAGTAALLAQGAPELSVDQMRQALIDTSFWDSRYSPNRPDTRFGGGRIDAYAAVTRVAVDSGVNGRVTRAGSGDPVAGATVTITPGDITVKTGADGGYTVRLVPGTYSVTASAFGHEPSTVDNVVVTADTFTTANVVLTAHPVGTITGTATLTESGRGIPGVKVSITGIPEPRTTLTALDGTYSIQIPIGTYTVVAEHPAFVGAQPVEVTVTAGTSVTASFAFRPPPQSVAIVGDYGQEYVDVVFGPRNVPVTLYDWPQLEQAAQHSTVILTYGVTSDYNAARFQAFLNATDASGAGIIFTDHAFGSANGIKQLSNATGQPVSTTQNSGGSGVARSYYQVTAAHPILDGYGVGAQVPLDTSTQAKWMAWFGAYEGDGRQVIASMGRSDATGVYGNGIAVQQRPGNRHVLMSSHGASATRGPVDWTPEATQVFLNAVAWAAKPAPAGGPHFAVHGLEVTPSVVKIDQPVTVRAQVKNVGSASGSYTAVLKVNGQQVASTTATIAANANRIFSWTTSQHTLGTYTVEVAYRSATFRVRPPAVTLTAKTVDSPEADHGPLSGATVELIHNNAVVPVGVTAADGTLTFDAPLAVGRYTLVVRRAAVAGAEAYLLHRVITVIDDDRVELAPRVLAGGAMSGTSVGENLAARVDLAAQKADPQHETLTYLRPAATAPWGFAYAPGKVVVTLDNYQAVNVHKVTRLEQDYWLPSEIISNLAWTEPYDVRLALGGEARVVLNPTRAEGGSVRVDWDLTDAQGIPFATVRASNVRPFMDLPEVLQLEGVLAAVTAKAPNEQLPILRLFAPDGLPLRAGSIGWNAQPYTFQVPGPVPGAYRVGLEVNTGTYSGLVSAEKPLVLLDSAAATLTYPEVAVTDAWFRHQATVTNPSSADLGTATYTVTLANPAISLRPANVVLQVRVNGVWQRVTLTAAGGGQLTGTVATGLALTPGASHTFELRTQPRVTGPLTFTNTFHSAATTATASATVTVAMAAAATPFGGRHFAMAG